MLFLWHSLGKQKRQSNESFPKTFPDLSRAQEFISNFVKVENSTYTRANFF